MITLPLAFIFYVKTMHVNKKSRGSLAQNKGRVRTFLFAFGYYNRNHSVICFVI